jgi:hypothetical protein
LVIAPAVLLLGLGLGAGVLVVAGALTRPSRPDLSVLSVPSSPSPGAQAASPAAGGWEVRFGGWLAPRLLRPRTRLLLRPPADDLRLLGRPVELWLAQKIVLGVVGLAAPALLAAAAALVGVRLPFAVPLVAALAAAGVLFVFPDWVVRDAARQARREFRHAAAVYIGWVAQVRSAAGGPAESLERAAAVGHGWALSVVARALVRARYGSQTPWEALAGLGRLYGVPQLVDLAGIMSTAGAGASIYDTLVSKQQALLAAELAEEKTRANERSERMDFPVVLLLVCFVILLGYPLLASIR